MITSDTFSVLFYFRKEKTNKQGEVPIYCRITINGKPTKLSTQRRVLLKKWSNQSNCVKGSNEEAKKINEHLRIIKNKIFDIHWVNKWYTFRLIDGIVPI